MKVNRLNRDVYLLFKFLFVEKRVMEYGLGTLHCIKLLYSKSYQTLDMIY